MSRHAVASRATLRLTCAVSLLALAGCATLGGNIKGDFACRAPDGICAPSSTIDDRALAMISGEAGDSYLPAGPVTAPTSRPRARQTAIAAAPESAAPAAPRTRERVLRVVFQPYIDERGRLHEASAVHTVVQAEWQAGALADATPLPDHNAGPAPVALSLADVLDRQPPGADSGVFDPNLPEPALVAAARARQADPIAEIKADVAARLAPKGRRAAARPLAAGRRPAALGTAAGPAPSAVAAPAVAANRERPVGAPQPAAKSLIGAVGPTDSVSKSAPPTVASSAGPAGASAAERVRQDTRVREAAVRAKTDARDAAAAGELTKLEKTVRAASFPAAVPEDK